MKRLCYYAYRDEKLMEWFSTFAGEPFPEKILRDWVMNLGYKVEIQFEDEKK